MKAKLIHPSPRLCRLYLILSGALLGACVTFPTGVGAVVEWFAAVPAALAVYSVAEREKFRFFRVWGLGVLFTMAEYLVNYHWFVRMYPLDFTGMTRAASAVVVFLGWWGLSFLASVCGGVCFALTVALFRAGACRRVPLLAPFAAGAAFALFEWSQTQTWMGVPWGRLALGQLAGNCTLTAMTASLFGSYFITFLIISAAFLFADGLRSGKIAARAILALSLAAANLAVGTVLFFLPDRDPRTVTVAAVQGNINSREKWDVNARNGTDEKYGAFTVEAAARGAVLVLYPETAYPYFAGEGNGHDRAFRARAASCGTTVAVGCFDLSESGNDQNVLIFYTPDGGRAGTVYAKRHLVPFGEYLPWRPFFEAVCKPLTELAMLSDDLEPGAGSAVVELDGIRYGSLICFDSIYETLSLDSVRDGAEVLLLSTNDSWFLDSRGVYMHNAQARLRAIETARPVVRAANTGVSSVIDARGRVLDELPPLVDGCIVCDVTASSTRTLYSVIGNAFVALCAVYCAGIGLGKRKMKNEE